MKRLITVAAVIAAMTVVAMPAQAAGAGTVSQTMTIQDGTLPPAPILGPCAPAGTLVTAANVNGVFHITSLSNGTYWFTGTLEGQANAITPAGKTYTGHFSTWFGTNNNLQNDQGASTFNINLRASDGSTLDLHDTFEVNNTPGGQANLVMQFSC